MSLGATLFLAGVLLVFAALDLFLLITLLRPGDERSQVIVWKASAITLLGTAGGLVLDILFALARGRALEGNNPFVQLGVMALVFCLALLYYKRKYSV